LFRGNNIIAKILYQYAKRIGDVYLYKTLKAPIEEICNNSFSFEIDPSKLKEGEDINANCRSLLAAVDKFLKAISTSITHCPTSLRQLCNNLRTAVKKKSFQTLAK